MASGHSLHLPHLHLPHLHVPQWAHPRETSARSGYLLVAAFVASMATWGFALVQLMSLRTSGAVSSADSAIWVALAGAAVLTMFLLVIWKAYRAAND